jgi:hypothetical protein
MNLTKGPENVLIFKHLKRFTRSLNGVLHLLVESKAHHT